ncbi:hypothetical protein IJT93_05415 [bacterium]|nr:hypothetical protein [bacterium]
MGEYFRWINIDKKEYIEPYSFDCGGKITESSHLGNAFLCALRELLFGEWSGDRIMFLGDYYNLPEDPQSGILQDLFEQTAKAEKAACSYEICCLDDFIDYYYRDVSCLFKAAESEVRRNIASYIKDVENGEASEIPNQYRIDPENPYEGLFLKEGRDFRFTVNHTKKVCYSPGSVKFYLDNKEKTGADPLPLLLACGDTPVPGPWLGDIIGVSDEIPEGYELLSEVYLDW